MSIRKDPIFIVGYGRSGTGMLSTLLTGHPEICIAPEPPVHPLNDINRLTNAIWDAIERYQDIFPGVSDKDALRKRIKSLLPAQKDLVLACYLQSWAKVYDKENPRWGDKFTGNWRFINLLAEWYPKAQFINIVRDPRDVASSFIANRAFFSSKNKLPEWFKKNHTNIAWRWRQAFRTTAKNGNTLGEKRYMMVKYEDLVENSELWMKKICDFLEMDFTEDVLSTDKVLKKRKVPERTHGEVAKKPHTQRIGKFSKNLVSSQIAEIEHLCQREIEMLGYPRPNEKLPLLASYKLSLLSGCFSIGWKGVTAVRKIKGKF